jgi:TolA-binding protein
MTISTRLRFIVLAILMSMAVQIVLFAQSDLLNEGIEAFRKSDFESAMVSFREVLLSDDLDEDTEGAAYFWLAKSALGMGRLNEAERNLEYYLRSFPDHDYVVEGRYQRGRILYLEEDFEGAIQAFADFIRAHEESPFVANATYWSAESLFNVGRLDESKQMFEAVLQDFPTSFRVEAARYRIALIELNAREQELLKLLQWSHQEYLQAQDEFNRREQAYQEAIASYQRRLQSAAGDDFREEISRLTTQVRTLQELLRNREAQVARLQEQLTSALNGQSSTQGSSDTDGSGSR